MMHLLSGMAVAFVHAKTAHIDHGVINKESDKVNETNETKIH